MEDKKRFQSLDEPAPRQPTFLDALAELARGLTRGSGRRGVDGDPGRGTPVKVARAPRRYCCSGKR